MRNRRFNLLRRVTRIVSGRHRRYGESDLQRAADTGLKFWSANNDVLTPRRALHFALISGSIIFAALHAQRGVRPEPKSYQPSKSSQDAPPQPVSARYTPDCSEPTINFDLKRGRTLKVRDVFKRPYLKPFSKYSRKHLMDHCVTVNEDLVNGGTIPRPENFPYWNVVPDGILLSFDDYQLGPHSFGQSEFVIPYKVLRSVIRSSSPVFPLVVASH